MVWADYIPITFFGWKGSRSSRLVGKWTYPRYCLHAYIHANSIHWETEQENNRCHLTPKRWTKFCPQFWPIKRYLNRLTSPCLELSECRYNTSSYCIKTYCMKMKLDTLLQQGFFCVGLWDAGWGWCEKNPTFLYIGWYKKSHNWIAYRTPQSKVSNTIHVIPLLWYRMFALL